MLGIVKEINGQKKIIPLTTDTGTGAAVGTLISQYKKVPMSGYLYCDGSTFDENDYPALYMYLGTNVLPDYRECVMVGAEQNTTDTIATHDVYGEGEFKDDQLQNHKHNLKRFGFSGGGSTVLSSADFTSNIDDNSKTDYYTLNVANARTGDTDTTHGKQKAVYVYIKATSGLAENQQENVLNDAKNYINSANSYSTNEIKTGGKWIDGKPIYRKIVDIGALPNNTNKTVAHGINNLEKAIIASGFAINNKGESIYIPHTFSGFYVNKTSIVLNTTYDYSSYTEAYITIEYTKTTD